MRYTWQKSASASTFTMRTHRGWRCARKFAEFGGVVSSAFRRGNPDIVAISLDQLAGFSQCKVPVSFV